jgi:NAD(P) transhydrogenase subunit alpha
MAASALGGNVELSKPDETIVTDNGVTIIAPTNLPATMPAGSSAFYARNISALLLNFVKDGQLNLDFSDEITSATVITHDGKVIHEATAKLLGIEVAPAPQATPEPAAAPEPPPPTESGPPAEPVAPAAESAPEASETTEPSEANEPGKTTEGGAA